MELLIGLAVLLAAVGIMLAATQGAARAQRDREERWGRVPTGHAPATSPLGTPAVGRSTQPDPAGLAAPSPVAPSPGAGAPPGPARPAPSPARREDAGSAAARRRAPGGPERLARQRPQPPPVDLNRAGVDQLRTLPGIGIRAAERIVAHRERNGPFQSVSALEAVEGFDRNRVARAAPRARV